MGGFAFPETLCISSQKNSKGSLGNAKVLRGCEQMQSLLGECKSFAKEHKSIKIYIFPPISYFFHHHVHIRALYECDLGISLL